MKTVRVAWPEVALSGCALAALLLAASFHPPRPGAQASDSESEGFRTEPLFSRARQLGPEAVPFLLQQIHPQLSGKGSVKGRCGRNGSRWNRSTVLVSPEGRDRDRLAALRVLGSAPLDLDKHADEVVPVLVQLLRDGNDGIRDEAILLLLRMRSGRAQAVPNLIELLHQPDLGDGETSGRPRAVAHLLGKIGPPARRAIPELTKMLQDLDSPVRDEAAVALWRISRNPDLIVPELMGMLRSTNLSRQWPAVAVMRRIGREIVLPCSVRETGHAVGVRASTLEAKETDAASEVAFYLEALESQTQLQPRLSGGSPRRVTR